MRVAIFAQHYFPESVAGSKLATQFAEDLVKQGHNVTFVTSAPNYPDGKVFPGYKNKFFHEELINGVKVIRTWSYINPSRTIICKLLNQITFSIFAFIIGLSISNSDVIFSYSPPIFLSNSIRLLKMFKKVPWILRIEDLFPETFIATGKLKNKKIISFLYKSEMRNYRAANAISLISETMKNILLNKGLNPDKLSVTSVWADPDEIIPGERNNLFRQKFATEDQFVILYSGNIGHTSGLEDIIFAAKELSSTNEFLFLIIGDGSKKQNLINLVKSNEVNNICFLPFQERSKLNEILSAADLCLVTLNEQGANYSLPSKTFTYMASNKAILSISPNTSELAKIIQLGQCGLNIENGKIDEIVQTLKNLKENPQLCSSMGEKGSLLLKEKYSRKACVAQFEKLIVSYATRNQTFNK